MSYFWEKDRQNLDLPKTADRRIKLTPEDKEQIIYLYKSSGLPIREIARQYESKCSRRTIQFVLFPERLATVNYKGHWKKYYDKERNTKAVREWRRYKTEVLLPSKI